MVISPTDDSLFTMPMPMKNHTMDMDMSGGMHMTFYNDYNIQLFFESWKFDSDNEYAGALVGLFCVSVFIESLNLIKLFLKEYANQFSAGYR